ncbi:MAG: hypothetical protein ACT4PZ_21395 [Panacagrimonas sp.]
MQLDARDQEAAVRQAQAGRATAEASLRDAERILTDTQTLFARGLGATLRGARFNRNAQRHLNSSSSAARRPGDLVLDRDLVRTAC